MNGLVGSILRWTSGASSAQNSESALINIGKILKWQAILTHAAVACPRLRDRPDTESQDLLLALTVLSNSENLPLVRD